MGVYDIDGDGLTLSSNGNASGGVDVGLWDDDTRILLGQVVVPGGTDAPILNGFRYQNLATNIDLASGEFYRVAAYMRDIVSGTRKFVDSAVPDTVNGIDSIQEASSSLISRLSFPIGLSDQNEAFLGGNILFEDATATSVPFEFSPALGLLLVGGLFGGSKLYGRYKSSKVEI